MAKFNPILGTASGKLGDIVLYRANGAQLSRVRVRSIKNPRTQSQALQRMVFATASAARSALASIVDHSFESIKYGQKSTQYFMKRAVDDLRVAAIACRDLTPAEQVKTANFNIKGVSSMAINSLLISQGSLTPFEIFRAGRDIPMLRVAPITPVRLSDDNVPYIYLGDFCDALGLQPGQQMTFVRVRVLDDQPVLAGDYPGENNVDENSLWNWEFGTQVDIYRLRVDPLMTNEQRTTLMPVVGDYIHIENGNGLIVERPFNLQWTMEDDEHITGIKPVSDYETAQEVTNYSAMAVIRSEFVNGKWQRSTQRLTWFSEADVESLSGASMYAALPTYMDGGSLVDSDKLLNYEGLEYENMSGRTAGGITPGTGGTATGKLIALYDSDNNKTYLGQYVNGSYRFVGSQPPQGDTIFFEWRQQYVGMLFEDITVKATTTIAPTGWTNATPLDAPSFVAKFLISAEQQDWV